MCCLAMGIKPGVATQTNNLQGTHPKISQRHRLCTHERTYNLDYILNNLQLSTIEEGLKSFRREAGEKPPREVRKRVRIGAYKPE